jgi:hypothetical protein
MQINFSCFAAQVQKFGSRIGVTMRAKTGEQLTECGIHHVGTLFMLVIRYRYQSYCNDFPGTFYVLLSFRYHV